MIKRKNTFKTGSAESVAGKPARVRSLYPVIVCGACAGMALVPKR